MYVLLKSVEAGRLSVDEYAVRLDDLVDGEFRMSASLYRRALDAGRELGEE